MQNVEKTVKDGITQGEILTLMLTALNNLYSKDRALFEYKRYDDELISERCLSFRLGWYIIAYMKEHESLYAGYDADCEYNRNFSHPKGKYKEYESKVEAMTPDLIIHKRGSNKHNLLVVEYKKKCRDENDIERIKFYTDPNEVFKYQYGMHIVLFKKRVNLYFVTDSIERSHLFKSYVYNDFTKKLELVKE